MSTIGIDLVPADYRHSMTRAQAKQRGLKYYVGSPCHKHGDVVRQTSSGGCYACGLERNREHYRNKAGLSWKRRQHLDACVKARESARKYVKPTYSTEVPEGMEVWAEAEVAKLDEQMEKIVEELRPELTDDERFQIVGRAMNDIHYQVEEELGRERSKGMYDYDFDLKYIGLCNSRDLRGHVEKFVKLG